MAFSFTDSPSFLFTSESVTEGHPDKLCDQISDAVLDEIIAADPFARVACETCTTTGMVVVMGEITTETYVDIPNIVRRTIRDAGYIDSSYGFDYQSCGVSVSIHGQSQDISTGVSNALETRGEDGATDVESLGAGDQGMMVGFACNETPELMPLPMALSHQLCMRMAEVRKEGFLPYMRPDGKSQVTVEYEYGVPKRVHTVVLSTQHNPEVSQSVIERDLIEDVGKHVIPAKYIDGDTRWVINPSGRFVIGGPVGDTGLTGRKILVDTYGGMARHGGGAFSGKDPTKVDRSAAYAARYVAKNLVAAGLADRVELQVAYAIGVAAPISISAETFGTSKVTDETISALIDKHFDLRPGAIIRDLDLRRPIYKQTAAYGHFGRTDVDLPWERTDKADALRQEAFPDGAGA
ncbi:MAG: methionine adenosyltransferase [SAR202 cluster bacterium]|jgi:S-adenosylmethionine synthetase|nr:methionine adenosyltransferase [SAR202 cluster bacterium]HAL46217.1 methionine adenosyltransferase [Dehalococcoidia bacterium]MDP6664403.1 methionine adenosyltransferase [SAR202 cluster bacterium]MDP6801133.1 methionine adenosyltransferase [SAR202 cluster bacterium]MQG59266.1 methionine adenosyltransferase [SAR202 cluster bacterium]|tara:strand:+ start:8699 stop:9922 length:1224 start_codon:yes stop_codon:yes gene_type:complete